MTDNKIKENEKPRYEISKLYFGDGKTYLLIPYGEFYHDLFRQILERYGELILHLFKLEHENRFKRIVWPSSSGQTNQHLFGHGCTEFVVVTEVSELNSLDKIIKNNFESIIKFVEIPCEYTKCIDCDRCDGYFSEEFGDYHNYSCPNYKKDNSSSIICENLDELINRL